MLINTIPLINTTLSSDARTQPEQYGVLWEQPDNMKTPEPGSTRREPGLSRKPAALDFPAGRTYLPSKHRMGNHPTTPQDKMPKSKNKRKNRTAQNKKDNRDKYNQYSLKGVWARQAREQQERSRQAQHPTAEELLSVMGPLPR